MQLQATETSQTTSFGQRTFLKPVGSTGLPDGTNPMYCWPVFRLMDSVAHLA